MPDFYFSPRPNRAAEIRWHEWGDDAFAEAKKQNRPILLAISAVWCHWCHVMDETSYSDPDVIQTVNEQFVPIRVDTDRRPDVNRRYNLGGWPTTAFLTPEGALLTGGTYVPPEQMLAALRQVGETYRTSRSEILERAAQRREDAVSAQATSRGPLSPEIVDHVLAQVLDHFDALYGGFGDEPKFPQTDAVELAIEKLWSTHDESLRPVVTITLGKMASGGVYDQGAGGFFRYSTTRDWSVPHFEKMLEDNARLLVAYVHAWQVTGIDLYERTARSLVGYVDSTLADRDRGGFFGSQDADESYYRLPLDERRRQAPPYVDHTFYTDWNARMASAYLAASPMLGDDHLRVFALETLDRIWNEMYDAEQGLRHDARDGQPAQLPGLLTDLALAASAYLDAYQSTGEARNLARARTLADRALQDLFDTKEGVFWSEPRAGQALGLLDVPEASLAENAAMAEALILLDRLNGEERYRQAAHRALSYFAADYRRYSFTAADYALAVEHLLAEPVEVHVIAQMDDPRAHELLAAARRGYLPSKVVVPLDPTRDTARLQQLGYPASDTPLAYVCVGTKCLAPVHDARGVEEEMKTMNLRPLQPAGGGQ